MLAKNLQVGIYSDTPSKILSSYFRSVRRLLSQLKEDGLLSETSSHSSLRGEIPGHAEKRYFPGLV